MTGMIVLCVTFQEMLAMKASVTKMTEEETQGEINLLCGDRANANLMERIEFADSDAVIYMLSQCFARLVGV